MRGGCDDGRAHPCGGRAGGCSFMLALAGSAVEISANGIFYVFFFLVRTEDDVT